MLMTRVATAVVLLVLFILAAVQLPSSIFSGLTLLAVGLGAIEWAKLIGLPSRTASIGYGLALVLLGLAFAHLATTEQIMMLVSAAVLFWIFCVPFFLGRGKAPHLKWVMGLIGFLVLLSSWVSMNWLHQQGLVWFFFPFVLVWVTDSAAFFVGRQFGRHKLAPMISPNKTWEGVLGALFIVLTLGVLTFPWWSLGMNLPTLPIWQVLGGLLVLGVLSIMGDLFESLLKRQAGVKDSGNLLPGHGGVLDRIDALLAVLPAVACMSLYYTEYGFLFPSLS